MPLDPFFFGALPTVITKAHVDAEVSRYKRRRPVVMLQCQSGWASYSAADGRRLTEFRSWSKGLLDFADVVRGCSVQQTPATRLTYKLTMPMLANALRGGG